MGRVKPGRQRRPGRAMKSGHSFGGEHGITAVYPYTRDGRTHFGWIDARAYGPGVQFFAAPVETAGWQGDEAWIRLLAVGRDGVEGPGDRFARLLATSTSGAIATFGNRSVAYAATPGNGLGALFEVDNDRLDQAGDDLVGPLEDLGIAYRARYPLETWAEFGQAMQKTVLPLVNPEDSLPERIMDFHLCSACGRPVFDSSPSVMVDLPGRGVAMVCQACADGSMLRLCRQLAKDKAPPVDAGLLATLQSLSGVLAG
ncbi:hypothetical protein ACIPY6_43210 [Streptomyces sp. NPDC090054]|uniref:hypothetical protein n=1 Tax=Streptomyces sp. NPDC090054 TaxID=3365933 RepID=UPI00381E2AC3